MDKRISIKLFIFFLYTGMISFASPAFSGSKELDIYHQANIAYQKSDYSSAINLYGELVRTGKISTELYFNLGNAYFKSDSLAKAILFYERAKKLSPDDEDIRVNLSIAALRVVDKIDPLPQIFYKRWLHALATWISADSWSGIFLTMLWLAFLSAMAYILARTVMLKKTAFILIFGFLFLAGGSFLIARESHATNNLDLQGIIMASSAYIKSSPDDKGSDLFILHEGAKVDAFETLNGWQKIRTANGSVGWIAKSQLEII